MTDLKFEIKKNLGIIGEGTKGWKKEVNIVSWNDRRPKLDIRDWDETHEKMGKGVTLSKNEVEEFKKLIETIDMEGLEAERKKLSKMPGGFISPRHFDLRHSTQAESIYFAKPYTGLCFAKCYINEI